MNTQNSCFNSSSKEIYNDQKRTDLASKNLKIIHSQQFKPMNLSKFQQSRDQWNKPRISNDI